MTTTLNQLKKGQSCVISNHMREDHFQERLCELGLVEGTQITVKRFAPLGDPMELHFRGYSLSIRKEDAAHITVNIAL